MESVILQFPELLINYIIIIFLDVTNFAVREHPSNIKIVQLNITKLRMGSAIDVTIRFIKVKV